MVELLQPLVRRDRRLDAGPRRAGELRRRLLAEETEDVTRALEVGAGGCIGIREQSHREAGDDRVDSGLEEGDPEGHAEAGVEKTAVQLGRLGGEDDPEEQDRGNERPHRKVPGVRGRDHDERDEIVDHHDGQHERAEPVREARADEREHAERERGVGRHRSAPAVRRGTAAVQREEDGDRDEHAAETGQERQRGAATLAQLAHVELPSRLEADDEEEERHQAGVDPAAQVLGDAGVAEANRELRPPDPVVRRGVRVHPGERGHRGGQQQHGAPRLGAEEVAQRRPEAARPRGPPRERGLGPPFDHPARYCS